MRGINWVEIVLKFGVFELSFLINPKLIFLIFFYNFFNFILNLLCNVPKFFNFFLLLNYFLNIIKIV